MKVISETYLMKVISETYLMKVITETYLMKVISETGHSLQLSGTLHFSLLQIFNHNLNRFTMPSKNVFYHKNKTITIPSILFVIAGP
jgi:hypothetical protein